MYLAEVPRVEFHPPWEKSFDERLAMLVRGVPRAAYFYDVPDTSTFRYRVYNVCQSLAAEPPGGASASWFCTADLERMDRVLDFCDVLVLCRVRYTDRINRLIAQARARRLRVLFDVDDLVFDTTYAHMLIDTLDQDRRDMATWDYWFAYIGRMGATMRLCDGAIVTNAFLAARAEAFLGRPARIIPNYLNREQTELSESIWEAKRRSGWARDGRLHLGYFSGSPSHNRDFATIATPLARLMDEDARLALTVVGFLDGVGPDMMRHRHRIEILPLQDFLNLQREIGRVEVNLVPLQDNVFTNCKSELKWFDAAVVGALTVAAPTYTFRQAIRHGENGWLAPAHAWEEVLRTVLALPGSEAEAVTVQARADALGRFGWREQMASITAALFGQ